MYILCNLGLYAFLNTSVKVKHHGDGVKEEDPIIQEFASVHEGEAARTSFQLFYPLSLHLYYKQNCI